MICLRGMCVCVCVHACVHHCMCVFVCVRVQVCKPKPRQQRQHQQRLEVPPDFWTPCSPHSTPPFPPMNVSEASFWSTQCSVPATTLRSQFLHIHFLVHATADTEDSMSCVKTNMAAPISSQFRVVWVGFFRLGLYFRIQVFFRIQILTKSYPCFWQPAGSHIWIPEAARSFCSRFLRYLVWLYIWVQLLLMNAWILFLRKIAAWNLLFLISVRPAGWLSVCGKNFNVAIFLDTKNMMCLILHDSSTHWALPIHTTFSYLDCISTSHQC